MNYGTTIAIAGTDFCVIAADTRISQGYSVIDSGYKRHYRLTPKCVLTSAGMVADMEELAKVMRTKVKIYCRQHGGNYPSTESLAMVLSHTFYGRRFFPYYSFSLLCGLDKEGKGVVYGYDAIGSFDKIIIGVQGTGKELGCPLLDNTFQGHNNLNPQLAPDRQEAEDAAKDAINSIAERDIYTGDNVDILMITKDGITEKREKVRRD